MVARAPHLAVIGERRALVWVLERRRLAFPEPRFHNIFPRLQPGDRLYLYTTRGCFHNPTRDRGRIIGHATVSGEMVRSPAPLRVGGRGLPIEVPLRITALAPEGEGIDLGAAVPAMTSFPKPAVWSVYLRRSLYPLTERDAEAFERQLTPHRGRVDANLPGYRDRARPVRRAAVGAWA